MENNVNNLNTYIELIKYTLNKIKSNQSDYISMSVIESVNKNISDIKKVYAELNNKSKTDCDNDSTANNDSESISSNDVDFIDPEPELSSDDSSDEEETSMVYYKKYPSQIKKLDNFNKSIYLY